MSQSCTTQSDITYHRIVYPTLYTLTLLILALLFYLYITAYIKNKLQTSPQLFYFGMVFFSSIILWNISGLASFATWCKHPTLFALFYGIAAILTLIQGVLLLLILFVRLVFVFRNSVFRLSQCTICMFAISLILFVPIVLVYVILLLTEQAEDARLALLVVAVLDFMSIFIWINYLFIAKLLNVYRWCTDNALQGEELKHVATKNAILCVVACLSVLLSAAGSMWRNRSRSTHSEFIYRCLAQYNMVTNFVCLLLTYGHFDTWYLRFCAGCHRGCSAVCGSCVGSSKPELTLKTIHSASITEKSVATTAGDVTN